MAQSSSAGAVISRRIAPFAPLAIALLMQNSTIPGGGSEAAEHGTAAATCGDDIDGFQVCHSQYPSGCSKAGKYDADLNLLKNQLIPPTQPSEGVLAQSDFARLEGQLSTDLSTSNHSQFHDALGNLGEGHVFTVVGYLYYAQLGGKGESSNCQLTAVEDIDFHIGLGFDPALAAKLKSHAKLSTADSAAKTQQSVIVEMTPHYRARFDPDWSLAELKPVIGLPVRVTGQLLVDNEHHNQKDDCGYPGGGGSACWRSTVWELHPIIEFQVCNKESCDAKSPATDWVDLDDFGKTQTTSAAQKKAASGS